MQTNISITKSFFAMTICFLSISTIVFSDRSQAQSPRSTSKQPDWLNAALGDVIWYDEITDETKHLRIELNDFVPISEARIGLTLYTNHIAEYLSPHIAVNGDASSLPTYERMFTTSSGRTFKAEFISAQGKGSNMVIAIRDKPSNPSKDYSFDDFDTATKLMVSRLIKAQARAKKNNTKQNVVNEISGDLFQELLNATRLQNGMLTYSLRNNLINIDYLKEVESSEIRPETSELVEKENIDILLKRTLEFFAIKQIAEYQKMMFLLRSAMLNRQKKVADQTMERAKINSNILQALKAVDKIDPSINHSASRWNKILAQDFDELLKESGYRSDSFSILRLGEIKSDKARKEVLDVWFFRRKLEWQGYLDAYPGFGSEIPEFSESHDVLGVRNKLAGKEQSFLHRYAYLFMPIVSPPAHAEITPTLQQLKSSGSPYLNVLNNYTPFLDEKNEELPIVDDARLLSYWYFAKIYIGDRKLWPYKYPMQSDDTINPFRER